LYYEVDTDADNVLRIVEEMETGDYRKQCLSQEKQIVANVESLVEGSFLDAIKGLESIPIDRSVFEDLFVQAIFQNRNETA